MIVFGPISGDTQDEPTIMLDGYRTKLHWETTWTIESGHWRSFKLEAVEAAMAELRYCRRHPKRISLAGVY